MDFPLNSTWRSKPDHFNFLDQCYDEYYFLEQHIPSNFSRSIQNNTSCFKNENQEQKNK